MPTNINGNTGIDKVQDGTVVNADIDTLDASKLTGSIAAARIANNTIDSAHIASGAVDDAHLATGITASKLTGALPAISAASLTNVPKDVTVGGRKNLIINGGMDVWQRGTSFSHTNGKVYTADRFWFNPQSNASTYSRQAVTSPIAGMASQYCLRSQRNSGGSSTGLTYFSTDLESSNAYACRGRKLTLSFYARKGADYSATSNAFAFGIVSGKGTDQTLVSGYTSGAYVANQSNTLTTSWQRFTVTTSSVIADDITQIGLQGTRSSTGTAGTNDYFEITGIQLEISDEATAFEYRSYGEELTLCQRYFQLFREGAGYFAGNGVGSNRIDCGLPLAVPLRVSPSFTSNGYLTHRSGNANSSANQVTAGEYNAYSNMLKIRCGGHSVSDEVAYTVRISSYDLLVDAEL